jgi:hypothetical protein
MIRKHRYLNHQGYTDRSFVHLSKRPGGFQESKPLQILVIAGAVRYIPKYETESYRLQSITERAICLKRGAGSELL